MMSDSPVPTSATASTETDAPVAQVITIWPANVLAKHLVSTDPSIRIRALAMAIQPNAPVNECVAELVRASELAEAEVQIDATSIALQLSAAAMGALDPKRVPPNVPLRLGQLAGETHTDPVRIFAAHSLFRLGQMPPSAATGVASLLLSSNPQARQVALLALSPFARQCAPEITNAVASLSADKWSSEALAALAKSAGDDPNSKRAVEAFVMRHVAGQAILPTGIAAYVALAQLNPDGVGLTALARIISEGTDPAHLMAALAAIGQLGEIARPATHAIAERLMVTADPALEEALCRAFVQARGEAQNVPLSCVLKRIAEAPDRAAAAHCMLLGMHPKAFTSAVIILTQRFVSASDALKGVLAQTYKLLTGTELAVVATLPTSLRS
jgi:hypothetical protein